MDHRKKSIFPFIECARLWNPFPSSPNEMSNVAIASANVITCIQTPEMQRSDHN